jgi:hypothetical protein
MINSGGGRCVAELGWRPESVPLRLFMAAFRERSSLDFLNAGRFGLVSTVFGGRH